MYILKNACISIWRNKGRNLLIGCIILVLAAATSVTLAIHNTANRLIDSYEDQYEVEATIGFDRESMMGNFDPSQQEGSREQMQGAFEEASQLSVEDIDNYGDSSYVKSYYYTMQIGMNSNNIDPATSQRNEQRPDEADGEQRSQPQQTNSDFTIIGYSSYEAMSEFISGQYSITSGEISADLTADTCIINNELATLNNIEVGDTITLVNPNNSEQTYELEVTGIFEETDNTTTDRMQMFAGSANTIITNTTVIENMVETQDDIMATTNPTFILMSKDVIDAFSEELKDKGLSDYLSVTTNLDQVTSATQTISNVSNFAVTFLVITLIIGSVVLLVINAINIRERKYEIGVLRTIGMKKSKLTLQFMSELMIVAAIALLLGAGIGASVSVPISNQLLQNEISTSQQEQNDIASNFGGRAPGGQKEFSGVRNVEAFDSIDAVVDLQVLLELIGIGLGLTLISGLATMISIQKFSPLTILKERS